MFHLDDGSSRRFLHAPIALGGGELLSLRAAAGFCIGPADALLWITVDGDPRDVHLRAGSQYWLTDDQLVLVSADRAVRLMLTGTATFRTVIERVCIKGSRVAVFGAVDPGRQRSQLAGLRATRSGRPSDLNQAVAHA